MNWGQTTVVVTGATKGIGRAVVEAVVERHGRVGCLARTAEDLEQLRHSLPATATVAVAAADVGDPAALEAALETLRDALGSIDVLVNNAGVGLYGPVTDLDPADAERLMRVNYLGLVHATALVLPEMRDRRRGHIVNVGSVAGRIGAPFEAAYSASKFAVVGFTEALAVEVAPFGIKVSMVNPGPVETEFFEARGHPYDRSRPRPVTSRRVAAAVVRAVESGRLEQMVPGSLAPAVVMRHLVPPLFRFGTRQAFRRQLQAVTRA